MMNLHLTFCELFNMRKSKVRKLNAILMVYFEEDVPTLYLIIIGVDSLSMQKEIKGILKMSIVCYMCKLINKRVLSQCHAATQIYRKLLKHISYKNIKK